MMLLKPIRRIATLSLAISLAVALLPSVVLAHAELDTPTPADKSMLTEAVTEVSGTFTQRVTVDGSSLVVKLVGGGTVAEGGVDPTNNRTMVATPATPLGSGSYRVEWTTISLDDDELARGTWAFTVAVAPTPSPTPVPTAAPTATPTTPTPTATPPASPAPTPVPSAGGSSTGSGGDVLLPIIVALIILGAGAAYLLSRRNRPPTAT
jgi:methionine-rich copper-binding protein CopC